MNSILKFYHRIRYRLFGPVYHKKDATPRYLKGKL